MLSVSNVYQSCKLSDPVCSRQIAVEIQCATKVFESRTSSVTALDNVSLEIQQNEFFTLLGPSGCGKTTLLRLIAGFEHPSDGQIRLYGEDITFWPPYQRPVNTVFQNYALFPHMTVRQNISFGLEMLKRSKAEISKTVAEVLNLVRMEELAERRVSDISGGQQQRVALARALAPQPKVLLLDESLSALDYKLRQDMQIELKRLQHETGITFVFVTHDQEEALTMSDRMAVMNVGKILQVGTPGEIYNFPKQRFVAEFIGDSNFLEGYVVARSSSRAKVELSPTYCADLPADDAVQPGTRVSVAVRPEQATLTSATTAAALQGRVSNMVYFGTHTHYVIKLENGDLFTVHQQNLSGHEIEYEPGHAVGVTLNQSTMQILKD